ncbi:helix-turn-helix domain-containing protein [Frankia sp. Cr1]|uniref:helix-turn-helix domain-containing protein n=1 Tax=Frankia sp. Cr1 TaxID=3073931 RepID=UPI002AD4292D|nr:helix-turn-helix domain-containing protein [Frankia sp. Cr1]
MTGTTPTLAPTADPDPLMTPAEVADTLRIDTGSLARWAREGRITSIALPNGHRRFRRSVVEAILAGSPVG